MMINSSFSSGAKLEEERAIWSLTCKYDEYTVFLTNVADLHTKMSTLNVADSQPEQKQTFQLVSVLITIEVAPATNLPVSLSVDDNRGGTSYKPSS